MERYIPWSAGRHLAWGDYTAEFHPGAEEDAHSAIRLRPEWTVHSEGGDAFVVRDLRIIAEFQPLLSWARPGRSTDWLLHHEQGRFDMAEVAGREFAARLRGELEGRQFRARGGDAEQKRHLAREDSGRMITGMAEKAGAEFLARAARYDADTDSGRDGAAQSGYDKEFARLLQA